MIRKDAECALEQRGTVSQHGALSPIFEGEIPLKKDPQKLTHVWVHSLKAVNSIEVFSLVN